MAKIYNKVKYSKWIGLVSLSLGTIIGQIINIVVQPILTRIYSPAQLGEYSYILSVAELFIPIASLKLNLLIVTAKNESELDDLTKISMSSVLLVTIIYTVGIFLSNFLLIFPNNTFRMLLLINPVIIFVNGIYQIFLSRDNYFQNYNNIACAEVFKNGTLGIYQFIFGILNFGSYGLIIGKVFSPFFYSITKPKETLKYFKNIIYNNYLYKIKDHKHHIVFSVPSQFISSFSYTIIMFSIVSLFTSREVGFYSISIRVLGIPIILISYNINKIFLKRLSDVKNKNLSLYDTYKKLTSILTVVSILLFLIIAIVSPFASEVVFGDGYIESGYYISILSFMFACRLVSSSVNSTFIILNKQNVQLIVEIIFIIVAALSFVISSIFNFNIYYYLFLISFLYGIVYIINIVYIGILCKRLG